MARDVASLIERENLTDVCLLGHSMSVLSHPFIFTDSSHINRGGKVAMSLALTSSHSPSIKKLIVVDIAPSKGSISKDFIQYTKDMSALESAKGIGSRKEAEEFLKRSISVGFFSQSIEGR